jgi:hypothetical protein
MDKARLADMEGWEHNIIVLSSIQHHIVKRIANTAARDGD